MTPVPLSTEHDFGRKHAILIGKCTCTTGLFGDMANGLDADTVSSVLGRTENSSLFFDFAVKHIFDLNQQKPFSMSIRGDLDLPP